ncbi:MAG: peptide chain release factor 1 [Deltaproteobacteria bacterium]|nr:MAG: peptide chain release factor 1 [Deltaproteobacteria bacterium]
MIERLDSVEERFIELEKRLSDPEIVSNMEEYKKIAKEHSELEPIVKTYRQYKDILRELEDNKELLEDKDEEIQQLAKEEIARLKNELAEVERKLKELLIPKDPNDEKNVILEIRAGTGGDEAALFAADLYRMYTRYAEQNKWKVEVLSSHPTGIGGFKEIILAIDGKGAYSRLKFESGVHRVQRVPVTESQGRIHTSAVTVAVLPEAEEVDITIDPNELRIDVFRSSGPGGQSVNTTDSAVRITHIPTGLVVTCQDEKSQHKNKAKALKVLRSRLLDMKKREQEQQIAEDRRSQVGTGDRSERIRTYNFPQNRLTDHRINLTLYKLESVLQGELDQVIDPLVTHFRAEALKQVES